MVYTFAHNNLFSNPRFSPAIYFQSHLIIQKSHAQTSATLGRLFVCNKKLGLAIAVALLVAGSSCNYLAFFFPPLSIFRWSPKLEKSIPELAILSRIFSPHPREVFVVFCGLIFFFAVSIFFFSASMLAAILASFSNFNLS